jgi:hypothetical protein
MKHCLLKTAHQSAFIRVDSWLLNPRSSTDACGRVITPTNGHERARTDADAFDPICASAIIHRAKAPFALSRGYHSPSPKKNRCANWRESPQISATYRESSSPPTPQTTHHGHERSRTPNPTVSHSIRPNDTSAHASLFPHLASRIESRPSCPTPTCDSKNPTQSNPVQHAFFTFLTPSRYEHPQSADKCLSHWMRAFQL